MPARALELGPLRSAAASAAELLAAWDELLLAAARELAPAVQARALDGAARALLLRLLLARRADELGCPLVASPGRRSDDRARGRCALAALAALARWLPGGPLPGRATGALDLRGLGGLARAVEEVAPPVPLAAALPALHAATWTRVAARRGGRVVLRDRPDAARAAGATATPPEVAAALVAEACARRGRGRLAAIRVLDPACGGGALLAPALERLLRSNGASGRSPAAFALATQLATSAIHGVDLDATALEHTRLALATRCLEAAPEGLLAPLGEPGAGLRRGNFLLEPAMLSRLSAAQRRRLAPWDPGGPRGLAGRFDLVLGNPPYVSGERLGAVEKAVFRACYPRLGGAPRPDRYQLFYERSVTRFLAPGGVHAFLVPDALLARDDHARARRFVREELRLELLAQLGPVFVTGARRTGVSAALVIGRRVRVSDDHPSEDHPIEVARWRAGALTERRTRPASELAPQGGAPWALAAPDGWFGPAGLRARLEASGRRLGELLLPGTAGLSRGEELGKRALAPAPSRSSEGLTGATPIYAGADVRRHACGAPSRALEPGRRRKRAELYLGPKVLLVKTGAGLVAAACHDDLPALQSLYVLHPGDGLSAPALAGLLSCAVLTAYAYYRWTSGKALQPQLTLGAVRALPAPGPDAALAPIEAAALELETLVRRGGAAAAEAERELDERVAAAFGLDLSAWDATLAPAFAALPPAQRPRWSR